MSSSALSSGHPNSLISNLPSAMLEISTYTCSLYFYRNKLDPIVRYESSWPESMAVKAL